VPLWLQGILSLVGLVLLLKIWLDCVAWALATPQEERTPVPWRGSHVLVIFLLYFCVSLGGEFAAYALRPVNRSSTYGVLAELAVRPGLPGGGGLAGAISTMAARTQAEQTELQRWPSTFAAQGGAALVAFAVGLLYLATRCGATLIDLGIVPARLGGDLALGCVTYLAIAPPLLFLQFVLTQISPQTVQVHPLMTLLVADPSWVNTWICVGVAVIAAPLFEEFFFRLVVQGWLERWEASRQGDESSASNLPRSIWPWSLWVPSAVFAALHMNQWPAPIALFLFALVLGTLYRRTHRLAASLALHVCLNGMSLLMLFLLIRAKTP